MRSIKIFLILFAFASCKNKTEFNKKPIIISEIDHLKTKSELENFIHKSDTNYRKYEIKKLQDFDRNFGYDSLNKILADKLNIKTDFVKADFDNNGYTDLLAIGDNHTCYGSGEKSCSFSPIAVMNFAKNKTKIYRIDLDWNNSFVCNVEYIDSQPLLAIYKQKLVDWEKHIYSESKTILTFKFGNFIEYNENPKKNTITKIEFSTSGCFGTCPVYKLTLNKNSLSIFNAQYYNFSDKEITYGKEEGIFSAAVNKSKFKELEEIINYADFENLNKEYSVMHTDDQTGDLKITFNDGKVKTISDYGMVGTYGLKMIYKKLAELRFNQKWQKKNISDKKV